VVKSRTVSRCNNNSTNDSCDRVGARDEAKDVTSERAGRLFRVALMSDRGDLEGDRGHPSSRLTTRRRRPTDPPRLPRGAARDLAHSLAHVTRQSLNPFDGRTAPYCYYGYRRLMDTTVFFNIWPASRRGGGSFGRVVYSGIGHIMDPWMVLVIRGPWAHQRCIYDTSPLSTSNSASHPHWDGK